MFQSMTWAFQITIVDLTTRPGSKVMTFQRHHYQPGSGQRFKPCSAVNLTVSGFPVRFRVSPNSTVIPPVAARLTVPQRGQISSTGC